MKFELVYAKELSQVLKERHAVLIDIREREDYLRGHWQGALNYSYDEIEQGRARLPRNRLLVLYCEHGGGSMQMARFLGNKGYSVATVVGGYEAMQRLNHPDKSFNEKIG